MFPRWWLWRFLTKIFSCCKNAILVQKYQKSAKSEIFQRMWTYFWGRPIPDFGCFWPFSAFQGPPGTTPMSRPSRPMIELGRKSSKMTKIMDIGRPQKYVHILWKISLFALFWYFWVKMFFLGKKKNVIQNCHNHLPYKLLNWTLFHCSSQQQCRNLID